MVYKLCLDYISYAGAESYDLRRFERNIWTATVCWVLGYKEQTAF